MKPGQNLLPTVLPGEPPSIMQSQILRKIEELLLAKNATKGKIQQPTQHLHITVSNAAEHASPVLGCLATNVPV